jgi:TolB protein
MPKGNREGRIVFNSNRDGNLEVYVINLDGTGAANLTNNNSDDLEPTWSPDGQWIAFSTNRSGNWDIFVMQANGADPYNFSNNSAQDRFPAWK